MKRKFLFYILIFDSFFLAGIFWYLGFNWTWILFPFLVLLIFIVIVSSKIQFNFFIPAIHSGDKNSQKIALTFDDGPHPIYTPKVLDLLKKHRAKASFFLIGENLKKYPYLVERILDEGHSIGNHSFTHSKTIDFKGKARWLKEIEETDLEIQKITGKKPKFFRPPYGVTTPHLADALEKTGHLTIGWNQRTYDTMLSNPQKILSKLKKKLKAGDIVLLHDSHENIIPILEYLLPEVERKNLSFVTINELINEEPYF